MSDNKLHFLSGSDDEPGGHRNFSAPLSSVTDGRLVFASSVGGVTIQADPTLPEPYRAHFEHYLPSIQVQEGIVTIRYHRFSVSRCLMINALLVRLMVSIGRLPTTRAQLSATT
jgi:hypothetical protein